MKTSNYILIALFSFIIGGILVLYIAAIGHESDPYGGHTDSEKKEYSLEDFSVMVVAPNIYVSFESSEKNSLTFIYNKDTKLTEDPFRISNDTLFIFPIVGMGHINLNVYGNRLSSVIAKNNSRISVKHINSETFFVDVQQAAFTLEKSEVRELNVLGDKAEIRTYSSKIESLSARLKNESSLDIHSNVNKVDIEKDETSRYSLYQ